MTARHIWQFSYFLSKFRKIDKRIEELVQTEREYVRSLNYIINVRYHLRISLSNNYKPKLDQIMFSKNANFWDAILTKNLSILLPRVVKLIQSHPKVSLIQKYFTFTVVAYMVAKI